MGITWQYRGDILRISWTYLGDIMAYLGHILGIYWAYLGHILDIIGYIFCPWAIWTILAHVAISSLSQTFLEFEFLLKTDLCESAGQWVSQFFTQALS